MLFPLKIVFSDMAQYPSPWGGGCQTLFLWCSLSFHAISHKIVLINWAQTPCGGWGINKDRFYVAMDIPLNFHCECFSYISPSILTTWSMELVFMKHEFYVLLWTFHAVPKKFNFLCKYPSQLHP